MSANNPCLPADGASCWTVPAEFVRLRYFFGQRLGVVDLSDEQGYVVGKQRFHNLRAHGAGVLCGLRAERYVFPAGAPPATSTTLLLVRRGAALDGCGREVIVGWDQCIDVAAWYRQNLAGKPELADWSLATFTGERRLHVAVRYRECPSDPSPAPRDPCGCETTGCDFGRVREGFELALLTVGEAEALCLERSTAAIGPQPPLERSSVADAIDRAWDGMVAGECAEPPADSWLCLASFVVGFDLAQNAVIDVPAPDNAIAHRQSLLSTAALQDVLGTALTADGNDAFLGPGPRITGLDFAGSGTDQGELHLAVALVEDGPSPTQIAGPVAASFHIEVHRFKDDGTWPDVTPPAISYQPPTATTGARFVVKWTSGLADGERYRVTFSTSEAAPIVDTRMRPLSPRRFARHFRLINAGGSLTLAPTLFDA
jgi:hypothetical protein